MDSRYCRNCGAEIPYIAEMCVHCGVKTSMGDKFCWGCGKPTSPHQEVCLECGVLLKQKKTEEVSGVWWLLPIFMGWLGGLIAWLVNKDKDPQKSRKMLITGIAITAGILVLYFLYMMFLLLFIPIITSNF